jgi:hypothetical protein
MRMRCVIISFRPMISSTTRKASLVPSDMPQEVIKGVIERAEAAATGIRAEDTKANGPKERKLAKHSEARKD